MILCLCKAVTDREVDAAIRLGAHTVRAVGEHTGAGTDCGCCETAIADRIAGVARVGAPCGKSCADCPRAPAEAATAA